MRFLMRHLTCLKKSIQRIKLVDRCLILLMTVLMVQSAYNLFANEISSNETSVIDISVRTTSAAIFGYFLSANFIKKSKKEGDPPLLDRPPPVLTVSEASPSQAMATTTKSQIGFSAAVQGSDPEEPDLLDVLLPCDQNKPEDQADQQVIIATILGLVALCVLLYARNFVDLSPASVGTLTQMRDFVSGCVGFLLGSPGKEQT